jgi:hypothetical protein
MFELTECCRLDKILVDLILQNLSLLTKNIDKYLPSLDVFSADWVKDTFMLSALSQQDSLLQKKII